MSHSGRGGRAAPWAGRRNLSGVPFPFITPLPGTGRRTVTGRASRRYVPGEANIRLVVFARTPSAPANAAARHSAGQAAKELVHVSATPVLALRGISKRFGAVQALTDVELEIHAGEVVALVGDNGAGKSTLVKTIAGVHPIDEGVIEWEGRPVTHQPAARRPAASASRPSTRTSRSATTSMSSATSSSAARSARAGVLDEVEMEKRSRELLDTLSIRIPSVRIPIASLSGGQRQTVAIARSLIGEPKARHPRRAHRRPRRRADRPGPRPGRAAARAGPRVILISHNMADVKAVADRVAVLRLGRNNGFFEVEDHLPGRDHLRHHRRHGQRRDPPQGPFGGGAASERRTATCPPEAAGSAARRTTAPAAAGRGLAAVDPRLLVREQGFARLPQRVPRQDAQR